MNTILGLYLELCQTLIYFTYIMLMDILETMKVESIINNVFSLAKWGPFNLSLIISLIHRMQ